MNFDLGLLRYFIAVAHELHFGKAAESLHVSQPALSRQVRQLEITLGMQLLVRTTRKVELTPAGLALQAGVTHALDIIEGSIEDAHLAQQGWSGVLRVAFGETVAISLLPIVITEHRRKFPNVTLLLNESSDSRQEVELRDGRLDIGLMRSHPGSSIVCQLLYNEPVGVVVPTTHHLAARPSVTLESLATENFIFWRRSRNERAYDDLMAACNRAGFSPRILTMQVDSQRAMLSFVSAGMGVSLVPFTYEDACPPEVALIRVEGLTIPLYLASRRNPSPLVDRLCQTIVEVSAGGGQVPRANRLLTIAR